MDGRLLDGASRTLSLSLIVLTIAIHTAGVVMMAYAATRIRGRAEERQLRPLRMITVVIGHIGVVARILVALHGLEAALWAAGYVCLGAIGSFTDALLYSNAAMTTLGSMGLESPSRWLALPTVETVEAVEAVNATLLFGISTAFIFTVMQDYWPLLSRRGPHQ